MQYIHVKNLDKHCPNYNQHIISERHLEYFIVSKWKEMFCFSLYATRFHISKRSIADMVGITLEGIYIIELKYRPKRNVDMRQIKRYQRDWRENFYLPVLGSFLIDYCHMKKEVNIWRIET